MLRRVLYALALILAPSLTAFWRWPIGAALLSLAVILKAWPLISAYLPRKPKAPSNAI